MGGRSMDLTREEVVARYEALILGGTYSAVIIMVVCTSFSVADDSRPMLRSRTQPRGVSNCPPAWVEYLSHHNRLVRAARSGSSGRASIRASSGSWRIRLRGGTETPMLSGRALRSTVPCGTYSLRRASLLGVSSSLGWGAGRLLISQRAAATLGRPPSRRAVSALPSRSTRLCGAPSTACSRCFAVGTACVWVTTSGSSWAGL